MTERSALRGAEWKGRGCPMKKLVIAMVAAGVMAATSALAADMPVKAQPAPPPVSPWDIAFGGALMTDYNFRGISQSDRGPSATAYVETSYAVNPAFQLYDCC